jgi:thiamine-monophosphate kinase
LAQAELAGLKCDLPNAIHNAAIRCCPSKGNKKRGLRQANGMLKAEMAAEKEDPSGAVRPGELALIERIRSRFAVPLAAAGSAGARRGPVRVGIGDDCAVLRVPNGHELVVTTDWCLEGRHFRRDWHSPQSAGHRCLARGLSDLAAMGARPVAAFLSLALPVDYELAWLDGFLEGFARLSKQHRVELAGGDLAEAPGPQILADIVCVGAVRRGRGLLRSGACAGDAIYVTGMLGAAAAALAELAAGGVGAQAQAECDSGMAQPQTFPQPRLEAGLALARRRMATSCMDLSDGIASDLGHVCRASGVDAELDLACLPIAPGATLQQALTGGEDYELLFTASAQTRVPKRLAGVNVTRIGRIVPVRGAIPAIHADGAMLEARGFEHFTANRT